MESEERERKERGEREEERGGREAMNEIHLKPVEIPITHSI